jgi:hypothetical protein
MNSNWAVAMDMPPCGVLAMAMAGVGVRFQIDGESRHKGNREEEPAPIASKQMADPPYPLQIFQAAAQE